MKNNQLLPFERNRYYAGKLLTSADFLAEQTYFNNKRRFANNLMFGDGIVCGLAVYNLDDLSVMVESGVAIDGLGREIVLENSAVKKLSAMDGFDTLKTEEICLCLRYNEEEVQPVYSMGAAGNDSEYEPNRVREGGVLFLADKSDLTREYTPESEFLSSAKFYDDGDYSVTLTIPATVSCGGRARLLVEIARLSETPKAFSMDCVLQTPSFTDPSGEHEFNVKVDEIIPAQDQPVCLSYWLTAQESEAPDSMIIAKTNFAKITVGGIETRLADNFMLNVALLCEAPAQLIEREIARVSLEARMMQDAADYIKLADITIQRTKNAYIIDSIDEYGAKRYIQTAAAAALRTQYGAWLAAGEAPAGGSTQEQGFQVMQPYTYNEPVYASGVYEIPIGVDGKKGMVFYSDEIMHGLGKGNIHVSVGFEYLARDEKLHATAKNIIYGDAALFDDKELPIAYAKTAVKVMSDRGSFIVAAKLTRDTNYVMLLLRWVAVRLPSSEEQILLQHVTDKSIAAVQPTVVLGTLESHFFNVRFKNMEPSTLTYKLTERDSGTITADGIYTAPNKEGVYEIRISCADLPGVSTYAYAVVKKKGTANDE